MQQRVWGVVVQNVLATFSEERGLWRSDCGLPGIDIDVLGDDALLPFTSQSIAVTPQRSRMRGYVHCCTNTITACKGTLIFSCVSSIGVKT